MDQPQPQAEAKGRSRKALPIHVKPKPGCPYCGSTSIKRYDSRRDSFGVVNTSMECSDCNGRWKWVDESGDDYEPERTSRMAAG
jgi:DnaJ-class molecular chaperone